MDRCIVNENGILYYYENNKKVYAGLIIINGNLYYIRKNGEVATGEYKVTKTNGLIDCGVYSFDESGKMRDGFQKINNILYYYTNGIRADNFGLILINDNYYYIKDNGEVAIGETYITNTNGLMDNGLHCFDSNGKMLDGFVKESEILHYYVAGICQKNVGLININGFYYYIKENGEVATSNCYVKNTNGYFDEGIYSFDKNGRMFDGISIVDNVLYYYINGNLACGLGLIIIDNEYYYVRKNGELAIGKYFVSKTNGLMDKGEYEFKIDGKMFNGIEKAGEKLCYYINGKKALNIGLIDINSEYYYVLKDGTLATGKHYVEITNSIMAKGEYIFDINGKMIIE